MRIFRIILAGLVVFSWLAATALAQPGQKPGASPYNIGHWKAPAQSTQGGSQTWQVSGTAGGGNYQLLPSNLSAIQASGSGCCCLNYLPLILK